MRKYPHLLLLVILSLCFCFGSAQGVRDFTMDMSVMAYCTYEGFMSGTGKNDFSYHSIRDDVTESMITRCTDGNMPISWVTAPIPDDFDDEGAGFLWIAAMDISDEEHQFRVLIDGTERFVILSSGRGGDRKFISDDFGTLEFVEIERDQHNDAHGYMRLWAPAHWLTPGKPLEITISGAEDNSNTWIIIYKAKDAMEWLKRSSGVNLWFRASLSVKGVKDTLEVTLPGFMEDSEITCTRAMREEVFTVKREGDNARGVLILDREKAGTNLVLSDRSGEFCVIDLLSDRSDTTIIRDEFVIQSDSRRVPGNIILVEGSRKYNPALSRSLHELASTGRGEGEILLMSSSHQDIAWMDSPEKCVIERDTMLLMPLILDATANPGIRFDIEDALMIKEFIARHPEMKANVAKLFKSGSISCGSTFIQPYEEMYSGESLARQFYLGARWLKKEFNYDATIYWNVDVPGRTLQMPQIMKKSGTEWLVMSRFEKGLYRLFSPDGSSVIAYSPGHYGSSYPSLQKEFPVSARHIADQSSFWYQYFIDNSAAVIPLLSDSDMSPAEDYADIRRRWNAMSEAGIGGASEGVFTLPPIRLVTAESFFEGVSSAATRLPAIRGERPDVWLYIHGPSHYEALKASREADILLPVAEKFWSALSLVNNDFKSYPVEELNLAWEAKIYPDHGWGGKEGEITDDLFTMKYQYARSEAERLVGKALERLSSSIDYNKKLGHPVFIFNSLNWVREDVASLEISLGVDEGVGVELFDQYGNRVPCQLSDISRYPHGGLKSARVTFIAKEVPPIGYTTYYYKPVSIAASLPVAANVEGRFENGFYIMELDSRGICYLFDRESGIEIIGGDDMRGGEVFTMQSAGNGAGEFIDIQQPGMEGYDYTGSGQESQSWKVIEEGDVFTTYMIRQKIRNATVERRIRFYHLVKKIDLDVSLLNWEGVLFREFRMGLALNMPSAKVVYDVPYGVVEVGKDEMNGSAGERYVTNCSDIHPRGIQNWIGASDSRIGVTLSSSVAVADFIDPRDNPLQGPVLQPILLASRQSCHWEGNDYLQTGDHHYHFSFTTHRPGWENGYRFGTGSNEKLFAVQGYRKYSDAKLPESLSFFSIDAENILVSAVKKAEDSDNIVIRGYDIMGLETRARINMFRGYSKAVPVNMIEFLLLDSSAGETGSLPFFGRFSIETFRLDF